MRWHGRSWWTWRGPEAAPGVRDATVNLVLQTADIGYDPSVVRPADLVQAVRDAGYDARVPASPEDESEAREAAEAAEYHGLRAKAGVGLAGAAV